MAVLGGVTTSASIEAGNAKAWGRKPVLPQGFTADAGLAGPGNAPTPASMNARAAAVWKRPTP
ncbi:hypothetical protein AKJ13_29445 [Methylobacterium sp. ARG-1]|nr:hypothetical protein AKJ13_29445 [Methylobacterium sp. ARG-1]